jgi:membrane protease subunit HflC
MKNPMPFIIFGVFAFFIVLGETTFIVNETKQALVLQFGRHVRTIRDSGLYFKLPILQQVELFERRVLDVDPEPERVILASSNSGFMATINKSAAENAADDQEKKDDLNDSGSPFIVDTFARYRITDPLKFRQSLGTGSSSEESARLRISNEMDSATRDVLGRSTIEQLLSKERASLMLQIRNRVNNSVKEMGIEIVDVRINRADLTGNLKESTFNRMRSEREQRAAEIRSIGEKRALEIRSNADKERTVSVAEARRAAQVLRGKGDESASRIYAEAYERDPDFYKFYRSLQAYKKTLGRKETTLVLSPDSAFFDVLKQQ